MRESIDQQPAHIVGRIIDWAHNFIAVLLAQPLCRSVEERRSNRAIIDTFEKTEATNIRFVKRIVVRIIAGHDSTDDFSFSPGEEKRGVAVLEKGMFFSIKKFFSLEQKRRHPSRITPINLPRKLDEVVTFRAGSDLSDFDQTIARP